MAARGVAEQGAARRQPGALLVQPVCYGNKTSGGGLLPAGRELVKEMDRLGILLDVSHLSDQSFWEAVDIYGGPLLATHNCCRALTPHDRSSPTRRSRASPSAAA